MLGRGLSCSLLALVLLSVAMGDDGDGDANNAGFETTITPNGIALRGRF
jgi:hypothetical protein